MTPHLTDDQRQAINEASGTGPVAVEDRDTHTTYVLIRSDLYERVRPVLEGEMTDPRAAYPFVDRVLRSDDAHDPFLDEYQKMASLPRG